MSSVPLWWERVDRAELLEAVQRLSPFGGCLVLEGDAESGRAQAATLAEEELGAGGYQVHRITPNWSDWSDWTAFEALTEAWHRLEGMPAGYGLRAAARVASRPIRSLVTELATMLHGATLRTALLFEDLDRDEARDYSFRRVFHPLAEQAQRPVVITYQPRTSLWPNRADVLALGDFSREDVRACLERSSASWPTTAQQLDDAVELVFAGQSDLGASVRPGTAYMRLQEWRERAG